MRLSANAYAAVAARHLSRFTTCHSAADIARYIVKRRAFMPLSSNAEGDAEAISI